MKYCQEPDKWRSSNKEIKKEQKFLENIHAAAFEHVCTIIDDIIIRNEDIVKLIYLTEVYNHSLHKSTAGSEYRRENLKLKIVKHYGDKLSFCPLGNFKTYLVYSSRIPIERAMISCFELGTKDTVKEVGIQLHQVCISSN